MMDLLLLTMAAYRITGMLVSDTGPAMVFQRLREAAGSRFGEDGNLIQAEPGTLAELFQCHRCMGFWVSVIIWAGYCLHPGWSITILGPFALAGLALGMFKVMGGR